MHKINLRCLVDHVVSTDNGGTKQVEHNMKYGRATITGTQFGGFFNSKGCQHQLTSRK